MFQEYGNWYIDLKFTSNRVLSLQIYKSAKAQRNGNRNSTLHMPSLFKLQVLALERNSRGNHAQKLQEQA
jgi:hypothetical protein